MTEHSDTSPPPASAPTTDRIIDALVDVICDGGLPGFSVQEVADRAGVSHRTVYRHFPTREALLEALSVAVGRRMAARGGHDVPDDVDGLPDAVRTNFALFSRDARAAEAGVRFGVGAALRTAGQGRRSERFLDVVASATTDADPDSILAAAAMLRHVASSRTWLDLHDLGLDDEAAVRAATWATAVLVDAVRDGRLPGPEPVTTPSIPEGEPRDDDR